MKNRTIEQVMAEITTAKSAEGESKRTRQRLETELVEMCDSLITNDAGSNKINNRLTITTGYTQKWDHAALAEIKLKVADNFWPFRTEYKLDKKRLDALQDMHPDLYSHLIDNLTITPRRPTVTIKPEA